MILVPDVNSSLIVIKKHTLLGDDIYMFQAIGRSSKKLYFEDKQYSAVLSYVRKLKLPLPEPLQIIEKSQIKTFILGITITNCYSKLLCDETMHYSFIFKIKQSDFDINPVNLAHAFNEFKNNADGELLTLKFENKSFFIVLNSQMTIIVKNTRDMFEKETNNTVVMLNKRQEKEIFNLLKMRDPL